MELVCCNGLSLFLYIQHNLPFSQKSIPRTFTEIHNYLLITNVLRQISTLYFSISLYLVTPHKTLFKYSKSIHRPQGQQLILHCIQVVGDSYNVCCKMLLKLRRVGSFLSIFSFCHRCRLTLIRKFIFSIFKTKLSSDQRQEKRTFVELFSWCFIYEQV